MDGLERVIDTREPSDRSCAEQTTATLDALGAGESFVLVADHDPTGLYYLLKAERADTAHWELLEDGPPRWRVRIRKKASA
ncbi:MAG: DUF2249 domain-containing protein [Acidothermaceae bacterium]